MLSEVETWFAERTWQAPAWPVAELVAAKAGRRVSVVLPALDEEETVGAVVAAILPMTTCRPGDSTALVDELVVMDSGSRDGTAAAARAAGARVVSRQEVLAEYEPRPGKGEVLWRSLAATSGDLVVFLDSDLVEFDGSFVPGLLGPLLTGDQPVLVKGFYRRPLRLGLMGGQDAETGGGRVTELLARPLLAALRPHLSGVVQPLGGEYAARRSFLESVPFAPGYGVEIGLLLDAHTRYGLGGIAQVNLGVRAHRHRDLVQLGVTAREVLAAVLARCRAGDAPEVEAEKYCQFVEDAGEWVPRWAEVLLAQRPPLNGI